MEETDLRIAEIIKHKWRSPIVVGSGVAVFLFCQNYPFGGSLKIGDMDLSAGLNVFLALLVIMLGFGLGFGGVLFFRKRIRVKAIEEARKRLVASETFRKVYWDDSILAMTSGTWETKIKWQVVDKIVQKKVGVHIYTYGRILFSIPEAVLPIELPADELIRSWTALTAQSRQAIKQ